MKFAGCDTRLCGGYWSYCGCPDCGLRRAQDRRTGVETAVLDAMAQQGLADPDKPCRRPEQCSA